MSTRKTSPSPSPKARVKTSSTRQAGAAKPVFTAPSPMICTRWRRSLRNCKQSPSGRGAARLLRGGSDRLRAGAAARATQDPLHGGRPLAHSHQERGTDQDRPAGCAQAGATAPRRANSRRCTCPTRPTRPCATCAARAPTRWQDLRQGPRAAQGVPFAQRLPLHGPERVDGGAPALPARTGAAARGATRGARGCHPRHRQRRGAHRAAGGPDGTRCWKAGHMKPVVAAMMGLRGFALVGAMVLVSELGRRLALSIIRGSSWPTSAWFPARTRATANGARAASPRPATAMRAGCSSKPRTITG